MNELEIYNGMELTKELLVVFANGDEPRARRMVQKAPRERLEWVALTLAAQVRELFSTACEGDEHRTAQSLRNAAQGIDDDISQMRLLIAVNNITREGHEDV